SVVQHRMQQFLVVLNVPEMMPGAKQGQELIAGPWTALAVKSQALESVLPGGASGGFNENLVPGLKFTISGIVYLLHHQGDFAALNDVVFAKLALAATQADAV